MYGCVVVVLVVGPVLYWKKPHDAAVIYIVNIVLWYLEQG